LPLTVSTFPRDCPVALCVDLGPEQQDGRWDEEIQKRHEDRGEGFVGRAVAREVRYVERENQRGRIQTITAITAVGVMNWNGCLTLRKRACSVFMFS
jgi:hypothetical protein